MIKAEPAPGASGSPGSAATAQGWRANTVEPMRILVCASEAPLPPMNGFRLQLSPVCAELAKRHEVVVLAFRLPEQEGPPPSGVELLTIVPPRRSALRRGLTWLRTSRPLGSVLTTPPMARAARELVDTRKFDVLHVAGWTLAELPDALPDIPAVITVFDANYLNYRTRGTPGSRVSRWLYRREASRIERFERTAYRQFAGVVVVSDEDAKALRDLDPELNLVVLPNGVDAEQFAPNAAVAREPDLIVFTGAMHYPPNAETATFLAREVLPLVRERRPDARLAVVGRRPRSDVRALDGIDGVTVTGEVEDVRDWLWRASVFACPMVSGTGIKNKLLEAMACQVPCVATPLAAQGMRARHDSEFLLAESATELARAIEKVLADRALADRLAAAARRYVVEEHSWTAVAHAYERLLGDAVAGRPGTPDAAALDA